MAPQNQGELRSSAFVPTTTAVRISRNALFSDIWETYSFFFCFFFNVYLYLAVWVFVASWAVL